MSCHTFHRLIVGAVAVALTLLIAATASADSLVYVKQGSVYIAQPDGSQARAITSANGGWAWPSETDSGVIAVAGDHSRIGGGFNPSGGDQIYEFDAQGHRLAGPVATQGSYSTVGDPAYVSHFRVAPDNSNVAWTVIPSFTDPYTSWRRSSGAGTFSIANDSEGAPLPYSSPEWWGPKHLLITHDGPTVGTQSEFAMYSLADDSSPGWYADEAIGAAPSYQVAIARTGLKFAVLTDDGPDHGGTVANVAITLETTSSPPVTADVTDTHCTITLPAGQYATSAGTSRASLSFSSDGSTLAWGQDDGIYEANVSNPNACGSIQGSVRRVVRGGSMPFLGAAALSPVGAPGTRITGDRVKRGKRLAVFRFSGSGGVGALKFECRLDRGRWRICRSPKTYRYLKKGRHLFAVKAVDSRGRADVTPARLRFKVR
ncbi:MAG: hypothetical protein M9938_09165 [Solirubrobacterales bacterium]|nr:hypothetical protein [Solirubrobacterales bacterium]